MSSFTAVTQSMQRITTTKLDALKKQQSQYEKTKASILQRANYESSPSRRVQVLLDLLKENKVQTPAGFSTKTIRGFLGQSQHDPSVSPAMIEAWERQLKSSLDVPSRKYEHAHLFGKLAMEWMNNNGGQTSPPEEHGDKFETVGRKEMVEQRKQWEQLVFSPPSSSDAAAIEHYLWTLFNKTTEAQRGLKEIRKAFNDPTSDAEPEYKVPPLDLNAVKVSIAHLLNGDGLVAAKQAALKDLQNNKLVLSEIADVLNMELDNLQAWSWGSEPIDLDIRRSLNGKYRVFMDEELLQAIFLQYVGVQWAIKLKLTLTLFLHSGAWKESTTTRNDKSFARSSKQYTNKPGTTVKRHRFDTYTREYFLQQLPSTFTKGIPTYDDGDDDASSVAENDKELKSAVQKKQALFHLITTEAILTSHLHSKFSILQSDFKWFGPSLPHVTIMAVMKFFGVPQSWLNFFRKYLQAPLRFLQDGPDAQTFVRKNGVPISHALTDVLGEAVLFCLDYAINVNSGGNLYRVHDDIWFWGPQEVTAKAWQTLQQFTKVMGMNLNEEKTGSALVTFGAGVDTGKSLGLPKGSLKWGFLTLQRDGTWSLDENKAREHAAELKLQLSACKSIFSWVQAWNSYVGRFLATNLGEPAECLGQSHIDMSKSTFKAIQEKLFGPTGSDKTSTAKNVAEYLKQQLYTQFNLTQSDIPDGLLFFPLDLGGLALRNPIIALSLFSTKEWKSPHEIIQDALDSEEIDYRRAATECEKGAPPTPLVHSFRYRDSKQLMTLEEVMENVEARSKHLYDAYERLMAPPKEEELELIRSVNSALETLTQDGAAASKWRYEAYWRWVMGLYGEEVVERFGVLAMGERRLLPLGLTSMLRSQRVRWQG